MSIPLKTWYNTKNYNPFSSLRERIYGSSKENRETIGVGGIQMVVSISEKDIFNSTSNGVLATDANGCIVMINKKALRIVGLKKDDSIGYNVSHVLPLDSKYIFDCLETGKPQIGRFIRGNDVHLVVNVTPIRRAGMIAGTTCNFQEMQQFENSALKLDSYLRLTNQFETVFSSSSDGLTIVDGQGYLIRMNKAAQKLNGWKEKNIIGKHVTELVKKGMQDKSITMEVLRTKRQVSLLIYVNATQKHLLVTGTPIFNEHNDITMVVVNERTRSYTAQCNTEALRSDSISSKKV